MTPTNTLLARFSALTFNTHRIHLDPDYARYVEGHRNLLVHGPLTQTLMLRFIGSHLEETPEDLHMVEAFEYKNLAPLYAGEELRLCAKEKARMDDTRIYDLWIEGPTGEMAVKGLLRTVPVPEREKSSSRISTPQDSNTALDNTMAKLTARQSNNDVSNGTAHYISGRVHKVTVELESDTADRKAPTTRTRVGRARIRRHIAFPGRKFIVPGDAALTALSPLPPLPPLPESPQSSSTQTRLSSRRRRALRQAYMRKYPNAQPDNFFHWLQQVRESSSNPEDSPRPEPLMRAVHVPRPVRVRMSPANRNILQRTMRLRSPQLRVKPMPIVRYHDASMFPSAGVRFVPPALKIAYVDARYTEAYEKARKLRRYRANRAARTWGWSSLGP